MRFVVCLGVLYVCLSSIEQVLTESRKYKKDLDAGSEENKGSSKFSNKNNYNQHCKGKICDEKQLRNSKNRYSDNSDEEMTNKIARNHRRDNGINNEDVVKYLKKDKKRERNSEIYEKVDNEEDNHAQRKRRKVPKTQYVDGNNNDITLKYFKESKKHRSFNEGEVEMSINTKNKFGQSRNKNLHSNEILNHEKKSKYDKKIGRTFIKNGIFDNDINIDCDNPDESELSESQNNEDEVDSLENGSDAITDDDDDDSETDENDSEAGNSNQEIQAIENTDSHSQLSCERRSDCDKESEEIESNEVSVPKKKVKYSIKFAHEKQKYTPKQTDNILKKIHGLDKKKKMFNNDDSDDDSSEEDVHPKRLRFLEDEEDY